MAARLPSSAPWFGSLICEATVFTVGDGSANYGITALYTAAQRNTLTVFVIVIVNNGAYGALAGFAKHMGVPDVPGLELGGIDFVAIAEGYGVPGERTINREEFEKAHQKALISTGPVLIDARIVSD